MLGLADWCDEEHICTVTFVYGVCRRDFYDREVIVLPMASLVRLSVQNRPLHVCDSARRPQDSDHRPVARNVASMHPIGSSSHRRTARQLSGVPQNAPVDETDETDDHVLMQSNMASSSSGDCHDSAVTFSISFLAYGCLQYEQWTTCSPPGLQL